MANEKQSPTERMRDYYRQGPQGSAALRSFVREQLIKSGCLRGQIAEGVERIYQLCGLTESGEPYLRHAPQQDLLVFIRSREFKAKNADLFDPEFDREQFGSLDLSKLSPLEKLKLARRRRAAGTDF